MKKLLVILVLAITLILSGCSEDSRYTEPPQDDWPDTVKYAFCSKNGNYTEPYCVDFWIEYDLKEGKTTEGYYTQDEVDELLEKYVPSQNLEAYQTNLHAALNEELKERYTQEEVDILLDEIMDYYDTKIEELELRLQELEETE